MTPPPASPAALVGAARVTIGEKATLWGPAWPRAGAFLARQGLEAAIGLLWTGDTFADQLICLPAYLGDDDLARDVRHTWRALSNACHAHPYELAPTLSELQGWIDTVDHLVTQVTKAMR